MMALGLLVAWSRNRAIDIPINDRDEWACQHAGGDCTGDIDAQPAPETTSVPRGIGQRATRQSGHGGLRCRAISRHSLRGGMGGEASGRVNTWRWTGTAQP